MYFGAHVSSSGGIQNVITRGVDLGADAVQCFVQSPRMWRPQNHTDANVARFRELRAEHAIRSAVTHASYLINIAAPDPELYERSASTLTWTMETAQRLGLDAVIFHPGSRKEAELETVIPRMATAINRVLEASDTTHLLLENSAGAGGTVGRSTDELALLLDAVGDHPRLGICLDTCHWYVSGVDITDPAELDHHLDDVHSKIGLGRLRALHVNDSKAPLGSNRDRHDNIGEGLIGDGMATFLRHPRLQGLPAILEVPGAGDGATREELAKVRALHAS